MARIPKSVQDLIEAFERLPGIGPKTAQRLTYYLLHAPIEEAKALADAAMGMKENTRICSICFNIGEEDPCQICSDQSRDKEVIADNNLKVMPLVVNSKFLQPIIHNLLLSGEAQDKIIASMVELAKEKCVFPSFEGSTYDDGNPENRVRNVERTTIAPTGTISMVYDVASGIEPFFA
ncbi:MAG: Recombination protein RecR, partial [Candidatus Daviesbacteria bacterium GW2011_GWB1_39_5]